MTQNSLKLLISKPCTENWATMTPHAQGKHCFACQKTVVDFTTMSDAQIIHYFNNYQGKTCGRFMESQLQRPILPPSSSKNQMRWAWLFSILLLPVSAKTQTPQYNVEQMTKLILDKEKKDALNLKLKIDSLASFVNSIDTAHYTILTMGDVDREPTPQETFQGLVNSFTNLIVDILSFFKNL
jgi:hypothetical protein